MLKRVRESHDTLSSPPSPNAGAGSETMLIVMKMDASPEQIEAVVHRIESQGLKPHAIAGAQRTAVAVTGNLGTPYGTVEPGLFESLPGVLEVLRVSRPYKLVSREFKPDDTLVE